MKKLLPIVVMLSALIVATKAASDENRLKDANVDVRMAAALKQAKANDPAAIPVLIDLLAVLPVNKRGPVEEYLRDLAGDWAPAGAPTREDEIARKIHRDAWAAWWANTDGPALLALLKKRTLDAKEVEKVKDAIRRLGDKSFANREKAVIELVARGRPVLPYLKEALKNTELEIVRRAQRCIQRIEEEPGQRLPATAFRLLALRKPAGALETLLAYLPFAEDETFMEMHSAMAALAVRDGKPDPALVVALGHSQPLVRATAAEALARANDVKSRPAVRKLLADADINVRLRVALALARHDVQAVPVLIALLADVPGDQAWQVHDVLSQLAGDKAPPGPEDNAEARKKASAAWAQWWKENSAKVDLSRIADPERNFLGYSLICESNTGQVVELDRDRKPRWSFGGLQFPVDAWVLPNNRVIIAELTGNKITERDMKGKIIWQQPTTGQPYNVQRLPNGNTFVATNSQISEYDRSGKQVLMVNGLGNLTAGYKARNGHIFCVANGQCVRLDATGKKIHTFNSGGSPSWVAGIDLLANGRILITLPNKVVEFEPDGKQTLDVNIVNVTTATGLPNGNILAGCHNTRRVVEVDRKGRVVWEYTGAQSPFRVRAR